MVREKEDVELVRCASGRYLHLQLPQASMLTVPGPSRAHAPTPTPEAFARAHTLTPTLTPTPNLNLSPGHAPTVLLLSTLKLSLKATTSQRNNNFLTS